MTLNVNHQLTLLLDLLDEHQLELNGQVSEHQQIKRLIKSLMTNENINNTDLQQMLPEIYTYSLEGESTQNQADHIIENQDNISQWKSVLQNMDLT